MTLDGALQILRGAPADVRAILENHRAVMLAGREEIRRDETLNPTGREVRTRELRERVNATTAQAAAVLRDAITEARESVAAHARAKRPAPATGLEALTGRQIRWHRVREMLKADVPLDEIIATTTDPETLHALAEELPSYLRIKGVNAQAAADIARDVDDQLAHAVGGKTLAAHVAAREAETLAAQVAPLLDQVTAVGEGAPVGGAIVGAIRAEAAAPLAERVAVESVTIRAAEPDEHPADDPGEDETEDDAA
ncbi:hypothetical protein [Actinomadura geliboluensis]|uniref:hypothetical protein n=1 Tax=Actinomadura geliboluensis TaxID=882440 RepID=UPI00371F47F1